MVMDKNGRSHKPQGLPQRVAGTYDVMVGVGVDSDLETASHTVDQPVFEVKGSIIDANGHMRSCKLDCRVIYPGQSYGEQVYTEADSLLNGARGPLIEISDPKTGKTNHYYLSALREYTEQYVSALDLGDNYMLSPRELSQLSRNVADYEMEYWNTTGQTVPHPRADLLGRQNAMAQLALSDLPYSVASFKEPSDTKPGRVESGIKITNTEDGAAMRIGVNDLGYVTDVTLSRDGRTGFDYYKPAQNTIFYINMVNRLRNLTEMREEHGAERVREYIIANEQGDLARYEEPTFLAVKSGSEPIAIDPSKRKFTV